jgi:hypothetical protein
MAGRVKSASSAGAIPPWFGVALVAAVWLLARPFIGLRHDGIFYLGQVLLKLHPGSLSPDLFFAFGSQDQFSVYSWLAAPLVRLVGLSHFQILGLAACHGALLWAVTALLRTLPDASGRWLGLVAVAAVSHYYGGMGVFSFAEEFVTARSFAEPLVIGALAALLTGRTACAAGLLLVAMLMHPLMAIPAVVIAWVFVCLNDRRWLPAAVLMIVPMGAGLIGIDPFQRLFQRYDALWGAAVLAANKDVLPTHWASVQWQVVLVDLAVLAGAKWFVKGKLSRLCTATVGAASGLLLVSVLGADLGHNVLITQLQLWRVLWIAHLLALALAPAGAIWLWRQGPGGRLAATAAALAMLAANARWEAGWVLIAWAALALWISRRAADKSGFVVNAGTAATSGAIVLLSVAVAARMVIDLNAVGAPVDARTCLWVLCSLPAFTISLAGLAFWATYRGGPAAVTALIVVGAGFLLGATLWDRRLPWTEYIESVPFGDHPFSRLMPAGAQVLWPDELAATWAVLGRPSYVSDTQGSGVLFNRATAVEFMRRRTVLGTMGLQKQICSLLRGLNGKSAGEAECLPDQSVVDAMCKFPKGPDFLVLPLALPRGVIASWTFAAAKTKDRTYYLYDCAKLR